MAVTTIETGTGLATLINVFTVVPEKQDELVRVLSEATEQVIQHREGFVAANIHASTDGTRVTNYAQWRTPEDLQAMLGDPACAEHTQAAAELADSFDPHLYDVRSTHHA